MLSYTGSRNAFGTFTNNSSAANLALGDTLINDANRELLNSRNWDFLKKTWSISSIASQQFYSLPSDCDNPTNIITTIGSTNYFPVEVPSYDFWVQLNSTTTFTSDTSEYYIFFGGQVGLWPIPSSSTSNFITLSGERRFKDLSIADYTTGTIITATNGNATIVGSGTSWTSKMNGRWIQIADSNSTNTGDGLWYQILSVTNTTTLTLVGVYNGPSIVAGSSSYVIGQTSLVPETYQMLPVYRAVEMYYTTINPDKDRAGQFKLKYSEGLKRMIADWGEKSTSPVIDYGPVQDAVKNPNLYIQQ